MKNWLFKWVYNLGSSVMMLGYSCLSPEARKKTWVYKYIMGGK
jgi:hypothetical protein